jgi:nucleoside-diphosphate-sugar epimerase
MIRWITQNLGTAAQDQIGDRAGIEVVDVRNMVDKEGNRRETVVAAVDEVVALLRQGKRVVVCCDYGMSRSNAVAAGALAVHRKLAFGDAVREVIRSTGEQEIKSEVLSVIDDAVSQQTGIASSSATKDRNRILITGGSGFIGRRLIEHLSGTYTVDAPGRNELDLTKGSAELSLLLNERHVSQLVHLASPRVFNSNAAIGQMLVALKNVIDACRLQQVRILFVSGWVIYSGYRSQSLLASETLPANPKGQYGLAKWLCERMLEQEKLTYPDFDYSIVRLAPVYGIGGDKPKFIHRFIDLASRGDTIVAHRYLNGLPALDLTHIDDAVSALALAVGGGVSGAFNIGSGVGVSTTAVAEIITELMNSRSKISHQEVEEFAPNIAMDSTRARNVLGWQPKANLKTELKKLIATSAGTESDGT